MQKLTCKRQITQLASTARHQQRQDQNKDDNQPVPTTNSTQGADDRPRQQCDRQVKTQNSASILNGQNRVENK